MSDDYQWYNSLANAHRQRAADLGRFVAKDPEAARERQHSYQMRDHYLSLAWELYRKFQILNSKNEGSGVWQTLRKDTKKKKSR